MGTLFAVLIPMLPSLIQGIETLFASKPKSGVTEKMPALSQAVRDLITKFVVSGATLPDGSKPVQPTDEQLLAFLEGQVQTWKATTAEPAMWLLRGGSLTALKAGN